MDQPIQVIFGALRGTGGGNDAVWPTMMGATGRQSGGNPSAALPSAATAGLCPRCGENLNAHPEHAHEPEKDPRWAALDELTFDE